MKGNNSITRIYRLVTGLAVCLLAATAVVLATQPSQKTSTNSDANTPEPQPTQYPVTINHPTGPPVVDTGQVDASGHPIVANCTTCHTTKPPNPRTTSGRDLNDFHQGLIINHGDRSCLSCHDPSNYNQLRLADGKPVAYQDVMTLCAQCHGPQYKDYQNGAHGGMTGYWDLSRGPRQRNNCIDCHDPHAPQYPIVKPVLRPNDRFLRPSTSENVHE